MFGKKKSDDGSDDTSSTDEATRAQKRAAITERDSDSDKPAADKPEGGPHRNIIDNVRNPETDDGSVNPHNEAMAQKPVATPLDRTQTEDDNSPHAKFRAWQKRVRLGGPTPADWEEFETLTGARQPREQPAPSIPEGARSAAEESSATPSVDTTSTSGRDATRSKPKGT